MLLGGKYLGALVYAFCSGRKLSSSQVMFMDSSCGCANFGSFEGMGLRLARSIFSVYVTVDCFSRLTKVRGDPSILSALY